MPEEKVVLIPNGIRLDSLKVEDTILRSFRKKWVQEGEWVLGAMGRLHRQKGIDIFLQAAKKIAEKVPRCRFLIAGDGPEKENLERLTRSLGLESQVTFCGWVKESLEFISLLDVFVLTSRWEGMPNVVLEAMALNKPVVSTNVGGAEDLIEDGKEGILIPSEDPDACSSAALKLYQDPVLKTKLSQNGSQKIRQRFGMDSMIRSYRSLYESLL
ncbi:MAG: glycosyltransferase [Elusimicrobia bacterium]|nr:glycosyltransferase [Elusimicrobiota bacterium]